MGAICIDHCIMDSGAIIGWSESNREKLYTDMSASYDNSDRKTGDIMTQADSLNKERMKYTNDEI
uniref:Uncharacterized protein n=1 Tax=Wuchereria bancrofti TaxID=6293 RepID=A0A1I8EDH7_WUCBA